MKILCIKFEWFIWNAAKRLPWIEHIVVCALFFPTDTASFYIFYCMHQNFNNGTKLYICIKLLSFISICVIYNLNISEASCLISLRRYAASIGSAQAVWFMYASCFAHHVCVLGGNWRKNSRKISHFTFTMLRSRPCYKSYIYKWLTYVVVDWG